MSDHPDKPTPSLSPWERWWRYAEYVITTGGSPTDAVIFWMTVPLLIVLVIVGLTAVTEGAIHALQALWAWWQGASTLFLR